MTAILLDTCAIIWFANSEPMSEEAVSAIEQSVRNHTIFVSPASAWEIGLISDRRDRPSFDPDPKRWFDSFLSGSGIRLAPCTPALMIASAVMDWEHRDPADRLIVATALETGATLVTRDRPILDYARRGQVRAMAC